MCNTPQEPEAPKPAAGAFMRNIARRDIPLTKRLRMLARNTGRKVTTRSNCCGHPGEPGC